VSPDGDDANDCLSASGAGAGQGPCRTIQGAIDKSASGDAIDVAAGVYPETLTITASLTIEGASTDQTIVDAGGSGRVATVPGPASVVLEGLTLRGGRAPDGGSGGGGLYVAGGSAVVLANTDVVSNTADGSNADRGGGIYVAGASGLTLDESAVTGNTSTNGGGIFAVDGSAITLTNSELVSNTTGEAGGLYLGNGSTASPGDNPPGNASTQGGGIDLPDDNGSSRVTLVASTVAGNTATSGGGVYNAGNDAVTLRQTILATNGAADGPECSGAVPSGGYNLGSGNDSFVEQPYDIMLGFWRHTRPQLA